LELGVNFTFVGNQYHLEVGNQDFYIDLLFYHLHLHLRCYVVINLKIEDFKPEFSGKMSFYVLVVDDLLRHPDDQPTIGMILCKTKNKTIVEYALREMNKQLEFQLINYGIFYRDNYKEVYPRLSSWRQNCKPYLWKLRMKNDLKI